MLDFIGEDIWNKDEYDYTQYPTVPGVPKIKFCVPTVWPLEIMRTPANVLRKKKIWNQSGDPIWRAPQVLSHFT